MIDVEITRATPERLPHLAGILGRAFIDDPMIQWPLDWGGTVETVTAMFGYLYETPIRTGVLWEAGDADGVAVWIPPGGATEMMDADRVARERFATLLPDGGVRYESMWEWLETKIPDGPVWYLDAIAVDPGRQGAGVGGALIRHGLAMVEAGGAAAFLETSRPGNVPIYEHLGFHVTEEADAPGGGPHIWFMQT